MMSVTANICAGDETRDTLELPSTPTGDLLTLSEFLADDSVETVDSVDSAAERA